MYEKGEKISQELAENVFVAKNQLPELHYALTMTSVASQQIFHFYMFVRETGRFIVTE